MADILEDLGKQANERGLAGAVEIRAYDEIKRLRETVVQCRGALLMAMAASHNMASHYNEALERAAESARKAIIFQRD